MNSASVVTPDKVCLAATDLARSAAEHVAPAGAVGDWVGAVGEAERVVTHYFTCLSPGYVGWQWSVTLARPSRGRTATVDEVVLLPSDGALVAPPWIPWAERLAPGDLGVGDLVFTAPDDLRLEPGYSGADATAPADALEGSAPLRPEQWELGLGRLRVLSAWGRDDASARWNDGDFGPGSPMAKAAPAPCASCGFLVPIGGALGLGFGLCANELSPADGHVVDLGYGCGAHSETPADISGVSETVGTVDELGYDVLDVSLITHPVFVVDAEIAGQAASDPAARADDELAARADDEVGSVPTDSAATPD